MFLLDNYILLLVVALLLFLMFTFLNIRTFTRDFVTAAFLTIIFIDILFRMPFKAINLIYKDREKILKKIENDNTLDPERAKKMKYILKKRIRIFCLFLKAGEFSYTRKLLNMANWYKNKPFSVKVSIIKQRKESYENKYLQEMEKLITA